MLPMLTPSVQADQVTVADKMFVEDFKLLGDQCYINRKCSYVAKRWRMASLEVIAPGRELMK